MRSRGERAAFGRPRSEKDEGKLKEVARMKTQYAHEIIKVQWLEFNQ